MKLLLTLIAATGTLAALTPVATEQAYEPATVAESFSRAIPPASEEEAATEPKVIQQEDIRPEVIMVSEPVVQEIIKIEEPQLDQATQFYRATKREIDCLASAAYYEARGEPKKGRIAVVEVVLARRDSGRFASNACGVIAQKAQFSFVRGGTIPPVKAGYYEEYRDLVMSVLAGKAKSKARGSTYFHATHVSPRWRHSFQRVSQIGRHLFYSPRG